MHDSSPDAPILIEGGGSLRVRNTRYTEFCETMSLTSTGPANQDQYWSGYVKKDTCFLSQSGGGFNDQLSSYGRSFCTGLQDATVLEIGCGDGSDAIGMIRQYGARHVTAVDIAETRVAIARRNVERAGFADRVDVAQMDAHQLAFPDGHFDFIYCNSVILFLDHERFFLEAVRLLKPGGRLVLFRESLEGNPILRWYRTLWPAAWKRGAERFARRLTVSEIDESGRRYFQSVEHREFYLFFTILFRAGPWLWNRVLRGRTEYSVRGTWTASLDQALLQKFPNLRRFAWVTVACFTSRSLNIVDVRQGPSGAPRKATSSAS